MRIIVRVDFNILITMMKGPENKAGNMTIPISKSKVIYSSASLVLSPHLKIVTRYVKQPLNI